MKAKFIVPVYALKDLGLEVSALPTDMQQLEIRFDDDNNLAPVTLHWPNQPDSPALKNDIIDCADTWQAVWQGLEAKGYYLTPQVNPPIRRLHFEDQGQDFLYWELDKKFKVITSAPFQQWIWYGTRVGPGSLRVNKYPVICTRHNSLEGRMLKYKITKIETL